MDTASATVPAARLTGVSKSFVRGQPVLRSVSLDIWPGEIHGLAGANGSGKSTLVKIIAGYHRPDAGSVAIGGRVLPQPIRPQHLRAAGVRFVHQEKGFIAGMSVLDNMCLGRGYVVGAGWKIRWKEEARRLARELERHQVAVALSADAGELPVAVRAKLAIIRALYQEAGKERHLIVLDEPTAAMAGEEASALGRWLREVAGRESLGVLFIGHRIEELLEVTDRISVLRSGAVAATLDSSSATSEQVVEALAGTSPGAMYPAPSHRPGGGALLAVEHLRGPALHDVSFSVAAGEIVGLTGVQGSGFEDVPYLVFDRERGASGTVTVGDAAVSVGRAAIVRHLRAGLVMVPADRPRNSVAAELSVRENVTQPRLRRFWRRGLLRIAAEKRDTVGITARLGVVPPGTENHVSALSGGNQQKVVLGKWLALSPRVLLLHEPTEGVDVVAKREIFRIMSEQASAGSAVVIASIEYEDLAHVCDRILVFGGGSLRAELPGRLSSGKDVMLAAYAASLERAPGTGPRAVAQVSRAMPSLGSPRGKAYP